MAEYVTRTDEDQVRRLLDELAPAFGYISKAKEAYFNRFYLDRLWYSPSLDVPGVGFEIERGIPLNERLRKDILNLAWSRAPLGFIIVPHRRILADSMVEKGSTAQNWYVNTFWKSFEAYRQPFSFYCEIRLLDFDTLLEQRSLKELTLDTKNGA